MLNIRWFCLPMVVIMLGSMCIDLFCKYDCRFVLWILCRHKFLYNYLFLACKKYCWYWPVFTILSWISRQQKYYSRIWQLKLEMTFYRDWQIGWSIKYAKIYNQTYFGNIGDNNILYQSYMGMCFSRKKKKTLYMMILGMNFIRMLFIEKLQWWLIYCNTLW